MLARADSIWWELLPLLVEEDVSCFSERILNCKEVANLYSALTLQ